MLPVGSLKLVSSGLVGWLRLLSSLFQMPVAWVPTYATCNTQFRANSRCTDRFHSRTRGALRTGPVVLTWPDGSAGLLVGRVAGNPESIIVARVGMVSGGVPNW